MAGRIACGLAALFFCAAPELLAQEPVEKAPTRSIMDDSILDVIYPVESVAGEVSPVVTQDTSLGIKLTIQGDVLFDFDKSDLRPSADAYLQQVLQAIRRWPNLPIEVRGYTDSVGTYLYNVHLSWRRADVVKQWLVSNGLPEKSIVTHGYGPSQPLAPNSFPNGADNPEGRRRNRRVEIIVNKHPRP